MKEYKLNGKTIKFGTFEELNVQMGFLCYTAVTQDIFDENTYYIAFDKHFVELSPDSQKFLIYHEIGHIENGDFNINDNSAINKMNIDRMFGITNEIEYKADQFAVNKTSKKIALKCLFEMKRRNPGTSTMDLIHRAIAIIKR